MSDYDLDDYDSDFNDDFDDYDIDYDVEGYDLDLDQLDQDVLLLHLQIEAGEQAVKDAIESGNAHLADHMQDDLDLLKMDLEYLTNEYTYIRYRD